MSSALHGGAALHHLLDLYLVGGSITCTGLTALVQAVKAGALKKLRVLELGRNLIGDSGVVAFSNSLCPRPGEWPSLHFRGLKVLSLEHNLIGDAGVTAFCDAVAGGKSLLQLQELQLAGNGGIGLKGLTYLIKTLEPCLNPWYWALPQLAWVDLIAIPCCYILWDRFRDVCKRRHIDYPGRA